MTRAKPDAAQLLRTDIARMEGLFARAGTGDDVCVEVIVLARLEQEVLLPALRALAADDDLLDDAEEGLEQLRELVSQVLALPAGDALRSAKFAVLREYALRHFALLREHVLPLLHATHPAVAGVAPALAQRRQELCAVTDALREELLAMAFTS